MKCNHLHALTCLPSEFRQVLSKRSAAGADLGRAVRRRRPGTASRPAAAPVRHLRIAPGRPTSAVSSSTSLVVVVVVVVVVVGRPNLLVGQSAAGSPSLFDLIRTMKL